MQIFYSIGVLFQPFLKLLLALNSLDHHSPKFMVSFRTSRNIHRFGESERIFPCPGKQQDASVSALLISRSCRLMWIFLLKLKSGIRMTDADRKAYKTLLEGKAWKL